MLCYATTKSMFVTLKMYAYIPTTYKTLLVPFLSKVARLLEFRSGAKKSKDSFLRALMESDSPENLNGL